MRSRVILIFSVIGMIALLWYIGFYRHPERPPTVNQTLAPPQEPVVPHTVALAAPSAPSPKTAPCPREQTDNGMLRLSVRSIWTTTEIGRWRSALEHRFVVVEVFFEAITDFQLASSAVLWAEEPDGTERTRSVATGALANPLLSLSPSRGEGVGGQIAFEILTQTRELTLHYDPLLARRLTLCLSVP